VIIAQILRIKKDTEQDIISEGDFDEAILSESEMSLMNAGCVHSFNGKKKGTAIPVTCRGGR
jgi:hypothetical protein